MIYQEAVENYKMPEKAKEMLIQHKPMILCGVTAAGKDTIARYLMQSGDYAQIVSHTTRSPRSHSGGNEVNGVDYWFVDDEEAKAMVENDEFVEVKMNHGHTLYGTSIEAYLRVVDHEKIPLLEIDVKGVLELIDTLDDELKVVFLLPPDYQTWMERLGGRGLMSEDDRRIRFGSAVMELSTLLNDSRFIPVVNSEVVDTAVAIEDGSYLDVEHREHGKAVAQELLEKIRQEI